jgi:hypothetical protein
MLKADFLGAIGERQEEFFQYFILNLNNRFNDSSDRKIHLVETFFNTSQRARFYFNFCEKFEKNELQQVRLPFDSLRMGLITGLFDEKTFKSSGFATGDDFGGAGANPGMMPFGMQDFADFYEHIETDTRTISNIYEVMIDALRFRHSSSTALNDAKQLINDKKSRWTPVFSRWNEVGKCLTHILEEERKAQEFVLKEEKKHLSRIYRDLKLVSSRPDLLSQVRARYSDTLLLQELKDRGVRPLDRFEESSYVYTRFDFYARIAHHLKKFSSNSSCNHLTANCWPKDTIRVTPFGACLMLRGIQVPYKRVVPGASILLWPIL